MRFQRLDRCSGRTIRAWDYLPWREVLSAVAPHASEEKRSSSFGTNCGLRGQLLELGYGPRNNSRRTIASDELYRKPTLPVIRVGASPPDYLPQTINWRIEFQPYCIVQTHYIHPRITGAPVATFEWRVQRVIPPIDVQAAMHGKKSSFAIEYAGIAAAASLRRLDFVVVVPERDFEVVD